LDVDITKCLGTYCDTNLCQHNSCADVQISITIKKSMFLHEGWSTSFDSMSESGWCMLANMKPAAIIISMVKPTRCTMHQIYFILEWHSTCFGQSFCPKHVECHSKIK